MTPTPAAALSHSSAGRLSVITGPMFSGKSEELMRRVRRARIAGIEVAVVSHSIDTRAVAATVSSHVGGAIPAVPLSDASSIVEVVHRIDASLVAIDEAQFFGPELVPVVVGLIAEGRDLIVEGLCVTFDAEPFEPLPTLMAIAEEVLKLTAVCTICGRDAVFHRRFSSVTAGASPDRPNATEIDPEFVGGLDSYVARCREHFSA